MAFLTKAELDYRLDVLEGRYRRQTKPLTIDDIVRRMVAPIEERSPLGRFIRGLEGAEKRLARSPLMQGFEAFAKQYAGTR